ncbi:MAG TPA: hypothetical protein VIS48_12365, partial [Candidatus Kryptonia bacterium]
MNWNSYSKNRIYLSTGRSRRKSGPFPQGTLFAPRLLYVAHPQKADFRFTFPVQKQPYDERDPKERDFWVSPEGIPSGQKKVNNK